MKILAVDDERLALEILTTALIGADYRDLTAVECAQDALDAIKNSSKQFDCILLDIRMPGIDGIELCRMIRSIPGYDATPIIMISALRDDAALDAALQAGATDYVSKPFNGLELGARLRAAQALNVLMKERAGLLEAEALRTPVGPFAKLSDPLSLDPAPGAVSQMELHTGLIALEPDTHALDVFVFAIANIEQIFEALSAPAFRRLLNLVAQQAIGVLGIEKVSIAYAGNGCFEVAVNTGLSARAGAVELAIRLAIASLRVPNLDDTDLQLDVVFVIPQKSGNWGGSTAVLALARACKYARIKALNVQSDRRLNRLRDDFRQLSVKPGDQTWFSRPIEHLETAIRKIVPRRVRAKFC